VSGYLIALAFMAGVAVGFVLGRLGERIDAVPDPTVPETPYPRERPLGPPDDEATVSFAGSCTCHRAAPRSCPIHGVGAAPFIPEGGLRSFTWEWRLTLRTEGGEEKIVLTEDPEVTYRQYVAHGTPLKPGLWDQWSCVKIEARKIFGWETVAEDERGVKVEFRRPEQVRLP
jgi:hypothetical protein